MAAPSHQSDLVDDLQQQLIAVSSAMYRLIGVSQRDGEANEVLMNELLQAFTDLKRAIESLPEDSDMKTAIKGEPVTAEMVQSRLIDSRVILEKAKKAFEILDGASGRRAE